jgi:hypothetical protein
VRTARVASMMMQPPPAGRHSSAGSSSGGGGGGGGGSADVMAGFLESPLRALRRSRSMSGGSGPALAVATVSTRARQQSLQRNGGCGHRDEHGDDVGVDDGTLPGGVGVSAGKALLERYIRDPLRRLQFLVHAIALAGGSGSGGVGGSSSHGANDGSGGGSTYEHKPKPVAVGDVMTPSSFGIVSPAITASAFGGMVRGGGGGDVRVGNGTTSDGASSPSDDSAALKDWAVI